MLRPGDPFERVLTATLVARAFEEKARQDSGREALAVLAGQTVAFCMGVNPEWVQKVGEILLEGGGEA